MARGQDGGGRTRKSASLRPAPPLMLRYGAGNMGRRCVRKGASETHNCKRVAPPAAVRGGGGEPTQLAPCLPHPASASGTHDAAAAPAASIAASNPSFASSVALLRMMVGMSSRRTSMRSWIVWKDTCPRIGSSGREKESKQSC